MSQTGKYLHFDPCLTILSLKYAATLHDFFNFRVFLFMDLSKTIEIVLEIAGNWIELILFGVWDKNLNLNTLIITSIIRQRR